MSPDTHSFENPATPLETPAFVARPPWLGGDLQTLRAFIRRRSVDLSPWPARRLELAMADGSGDRLLAALQDPGSLGTRSLAVLLHGLTGCEDSSYMRETAHHLLGHGIPVLRLNLRGAGPSRPSCRFQYHSGRSQDLHDALRALSGLDAGLLRAGLFLVGYSLGANMLIKFLAEHGRDFPILGAVAVSAPIDLEAAQIRLMAPRNRLYHRYLLARMKEEALAPGAELSAAEREAVAAARDVRDFDERVTAPRNGFAGAADYYRRCSAQRFLAAVPVPSLAIHARDDPWIPAETYLGFDWSRAPRVTPLLPASGGHVGFHARGSRVRWSDLRIGEFYAALCGPGPAERAGESAAAF